MAATGPLSALIEATAVSIGAGMLLGGFIAALIALVLELEPVKRENAVGFGSSLAGLVTAVVLVVEAITR